MTLRKIKITFNEIESTILIIVIMFWLNSVRSLNGSKLF